MLNSKSLRKQIQKIFKKRKKQIPFFLILLIFCLAILFPFLIYNLAFTKLIFPQIYVADVSVGLLTKEEAANKMASQMKVPSKLFFEGKDQKFQIENKNIELTYDFRQSSQAAFDLYRTGNILYDFGRRILAFFVKKTIGLRLNLNEAKLNQEIKRIAKEVNIEAIPPSLKVKNGKVLVEKGSTGIYLDEKLLKILVGEKLAYAREDSISLPLKMVDLTLSESDATNFGHRAEKLLGKSIVLKFEYQSFTYKENELLKLLDPHKGYDQLEIEKIVNELSSQINREPQNPTFVFEAGRVVEFSPAKDGITLKENLLTDMLTGNIRSLESTDQKQITLDIPVERKTPKIQTSEVNNLGIKELIGRGTSRFYGSIPNRIYNIKFASGKFKGVLISPGEILSFNNIVGDVSEQTGFKQAYIIKEGKTILGDGGGVCQVSSTLFRAALNAGLPILERQAHAYRVSYYEQDSPPGLDATVFAPSPDLKIKNDTPAHILIQPVFDAKNLTLAFEIYGTNDGRIATTSKPSVTDIVPAPEDLYVDDPTLPTGKIKQIDYKAAGAKVTFKYKVERDDEVIYQKTFISNYRPWQAIYLKGTGQ
jgi:vancomycin resistance protein YoaR